MQKTALLILTVAFGGVAMRDAHADVDMRAQARTLLSAMEGDAHRVSILLRTTRASRSNGPTKCVSTLLSQIDANVRHGRDDVADIQSAVATGDSATATRAMGWLASRREAARNASFAADSCVVPTLAQERDQTVVHVVMNSSLPSDAAVFQQR